MNRIGAVAYGIVALVVLALFIDGYENPLFWFYDHAGSTSMFALGLAGTAFASLAPFLLSLFCWRLARRVRPGWAVHLLFIPCAVALFYAGVLVLDYADGPAVEDHAKELLLAALLLLPFTLLVHAGALLFEIAATLRRRLAAAR